MAYRLTHGEQIMDDVRRIGHEQASKALVRLDTASDTNEFGELRECVHASRKHCKKLRGLVRLVRPGMEDASQASNTTFRDAARRLGPIRNAHAISDTFDELLDVVGACVPDAAAQVGSRLRDAATGMSDDEVKDRIAGARRLITEGVELIRQWEVDDASTAVEGGIAKTYKRSRNRLDDLHECVETQTLHQWRKRVKYGWYHSRLLRNAAPSILTRQAARLHDLSDALGDDHDLAIIDRRLGALEDDGTDGLSAVRRWLSGWSGICSVVRCLSARAS